MWHTFRPTYFNDEGDYHENSKIQEQTFVEKNIPQDSEVDEFFDLITEQKIQVVVLLEKICWEDSEVLERLRYYWEPLPRGPKIDKKYKFIKSKTEFRKNYELISVSIESENVLYNFKVFRYQLISEDVPTSVKSFVNFLEEARIANCPSNNRTPTIAPIIVHSDGGAGLAGLISVIEIGMDFFWFNKNTINIRELIANNVRVMLSMKDIKKKQIEFCHKVLDMYAKKLGITFDEYYALFFTFPLSSSLYTHSSSVYTYWSHTHRHLCG